MRGDHLALSPRSPALSRVIGAAVLAVLGMLVVLAVSRTTPSHAISYVAHSPAPPPPKPTMTHSLQMPSSGPTRPAPSHDSAVFVVLFAIGFCVAALVVAFVALRLLPLLSSRWRPARADRRAHGKLHRADVPVGNSTRPGTADAVADAVTDSLTDLLQRGSVAEAIIASWLAVEAALQRAGMTVRRSDTSTELVERALASFGVRESALRSLSDLYREARFSTHRLPETDRERARNDLLALRADLRTPSHAS